MTTQVNWSPSDVLTREVIEGRDVRLEPMSAIDHGQDLYAAFTGEGAAEQFRWLSEDPPGDWPAFQDWLDQAEMSSDPLYFAIVDKASGQAAGRFTFMNNDAVNGTVGIGHVHFGPKLKQKRGGTEAFYLIASHVFDRMGYRRMTWKCNNSNEPSKKAALRFGFTFEGVFRQHQIIKGMNRDTAWFSIIDSEWPELREAYRIWLDDANFDGEGKQKRRLEDIRMTIVQGI